MYPDVGVYKLHNPITGKFYIGSGVLKAREWYHFRSLARGNHVNSKLQQAYNEDSNFVFDIIENIKLPYEQESRMRALAIEQQLINENISNSNFLNIHNTALVPYFKRKHSAETIQRMKEISQKRWSDLKAKEELLTFRKQQIAKRTPEKIQKIHNNISQAQIDRYKRTGGSPTKGQIRDEEFKKRNSEIVTELWKDPKFRAKIIKAREGKNYIPPGIKVEIHGKIYDSICQAAKEYRMTKQGLIYRISTTSKKFSEWKKL